MVNLGQSLLRKTLYMGDPASSLPPPQASGGGREEQGRGQRLTKKGGEGRREEREKLSQGRERNESHSRVVLVFQAHFTFQKNELLLMT